MKTKSSISQKLFTNAKSLKTLISENKKNIVLTYLISLLVALVLNIFILYHGSEKKLPKEAFVFLYNIGGVSQFLTDTVWKISENNVDAWKTIGKYYTIIFGAISLLFSIPLSIFSFYKINKKTAILNFTWAISFFLWLCFLKYYKYLNNIILSISWYIDSFLLKNVTHKDINNKFDIDSISKVSRLFFILIRITIAAIIVGVSFGLLYKKGCSFANFDTLIKYYCLKNKKTNFIQKLNIINIVHLIINIIIKSTLLKNTVPGTKRVLFDSNKLIFLLFFSILYIIMINKIVSFIFKKFKLISIYIISSKYKEIQKELHLNNYKYNGNISFIKDFEKDYNERVKINIITSLENYTKIENIVKKTDKDALVFIIPVYKVNQNYKIF